MLRGKAAKFGVMLLVGLTAGLLGGGSPAAAASLKERMARQEIRQVIRLRAGHSKVLRVPFAIIRISVADPEVADIILTSEREIYINGLTPGVTNISLWGKGRFTSATVTVEGDVTLLKEKLAQVLPKEKIAVEAAGDTVVLSGEVSGPIAQQTAMKLAAPFAGGKKEKVVNLLHVGGIQQVMVEVRLAEINRSVGDRIGINFNIVDRSGRGFGVSMLNNLTSLPQPFVSNFAGTSLGATNLTNAIQGLGGGINGTILWTLFFDLLKQNNLGRILAEPNLVTTSGQEASFLAGGEFPVPVPQQFQTITIEWKKFGVGLVFLPTVLDDGKINLKVSPEVSDLDFTTAVTIQGTTVPGLTVRRMSTNVEVKDGQTFAIAGLLNDSHRNIVSKFPVLGDIPILGTLFRSVQFQKRQTELVVLVTPHMVKPVTDTARRLPTDKWIEPSDFEIYLLGQLQGREKPAPPAPPPSASGILPGKFGRQPVE
jgi:pilus assembly protein CpaC